MIYWFCKMVGRGMLIKLYFYLTSILEVLNIASPTKSGKLQDSQC